LLPANHISPLLFRGQRDSKRKLETTLERYCGNKYKALEKYYCAIYNAKSKIENFIKGEWPIPTPTEHKQWLEKKHFLWGALATEYMIYLRHHGFPSPLLDWSLDRNIAAFFAFGDLPIIETDSNVSIYAYIGFLSNSKWYEINEPRIYGRGLKDKSELAPLARHNRQEAQYIYMSG